MHTKYGTSGWLEQSAPDAWDHPKRLTPTNDDPVWRFHVVVDKPVTNPQSPIDGYLFLEASNGNMVCANLPMLN